MKADFLQTLTSWLPEAEVNDFITSINAAPPVSIRQHARKAKGELFPGSPSIPWYSREGTWTAGPFYARSSFSCRSLLRTGSFWHIRWPVGTPSGRHGCSPRFRCLCIARRKKHPAAGYPSRRRLFGKQRNHSITHTCSHRQYSPVGIRKRYGNRKRSFGFPCPGRLL